MKNARYDGKPMLRLLELYVFWSIGKLPDEDAARLSAMAPKLQETFGGSGTWQSAIETSMDLPSTMPDLIRGNWSRNSEIAAKAGETLLPQDFAEMFVDANLR